MDGITQLQVQRVTIQELSPSPTLLPKHPTTEFEAILWNHPDIVRPCTTEQTVKHNSLTLYPHSWSSSTCPPVQNITQAPQDSKTTF